MIVFLAGKGEFVSNCLLTEIGSKLAVGGSFFDSHDPRIKGLCRLSFKVNPKYFSQHELRVSFLPVFIKLCHNCRVVIGIFDWKFVSGKKMKFE